MKIAFIGHKRIPSSEGGIEKGIEARAVRMAGKGHAVTVYNRGVPGKPRTAKMYRGVRVVTIPTPPGAAEVPVYSLLSTLHAAFHRYDVVSYHASGPCAMIPLAKLLGLHCTASLHGLDSRRDKWSGFASRYLEWGERQAALRADACLVPSLAIREYIQNTYHVTPLLFANGIETPVPVDVERLLSGYGLEPEQYILSLGRLVPEKGIDELIRAFRRLNTTLRLVIAGTGSEICCNELRSLAEGDPRILFIGHVEGPAVTALYKGTRLFVLPSHLEGMANTLLEAMSCGCCCLVSDIPENTAVTGDRAEIFRCRDEDDLTEKLRALLDDPERVRRYRAGVAEYALARYNWDYVVEQLLRVYSGDLVNYEDLEPAIVERSRSL